MRGPRSQALFSESRRSWRRPIARSAHSHSAAIRRDADLTGRRPIEEERKGVVQNGGPSTAGKIRTAPLWGLRTRGRLMHDGLSLTFADAIQRHRGEAWYSYLRFRAMSSLHREQLLTFLRSL